MHRPGSRADVEFPPAVGAVFEENADDNSLAGAARDGSPAPRCRVGLGFRDGSQVDLDPNDVTSAEFRTAAGRLLGRRVPPGG